MTPREGLNQPLAPWFRRLAAGFILLVAHQWASCHLVFRAEPAAPSSELFLGCFVGQIASPPGAGKIRVILDQVGAGDTLSGCMESGAVLATLSGNVDSENRQKARFTGVTNTGGSFTFLATRQPPGDAAATALDLENLNFSPFELATGLPKCSPTETVTCADLFLSVPFLPSGQGR